MVTKVTAYKYKSFLAQRFANPARRAVPLVTCHRRANLVKLLLEWLSAPYCFPRIPKRLIR